jgi:hypothetical protein
MLRTNRLFLPSRMLTFKKILNRSRRNLVVMITKSLLGAFHFRIMLNPGEGLPWLVLILLSRLSFTGNGDSYKILCSDKRFWLVYVGHYKLEGNTSARTTYAVGHIPACSILPRYPWSSVSLHSRVSCCRLFCQVHVSQFVPCIKM